MYLNRHVFATSTAALLLATIILPFESASAQTIPSLKDAYRKDFGIGTCLNNAQIDERDPKTTEFIVRQFNMATPENIMKSALLHPKWDTYNFEMADKLVAFGKKHNIKINGHTLVWHSQLPPFIRGIKSPDSIRTFFTDHIKTVAGRYEGKVFSWDVVNEALNEDGTLRKSVFLQHLGDDYITEAFRLAQQAAPKTELYYNDYNNEQPKKRAGCIDIVKKIKAAGVRIDGVGIQGHWHVGKVPFADIEESILQYAALGVKVMFTELDIEVLPRNFQGADVGARMTANEQSNPYVNGLPDAVQQQLAADYENLFKLFLKHKDKVTRVTFWGVNDGDSWLNGWPIRGRTNYPLLFDRNNQPKPAFEKVIALKK